jgi:hypothetical protein
MKMSRSYVLILGALLVALLGPACTKVVRVQPEDGGEAVHATVYRIRTTDGKRYAATEYAVNDSAIVVVSLETDRPPGADDADVPFTIPRNEIESIDRVSLNRDRFFYVASGITVAVAVMMWVFSSIGGGT